MDKTQDNIAKQLAIQEIIEKLQKTTMKEPYMTNGLTRVRDAVDKVLAGKYTRGSV